MTRLTIARLTAFTPIIVAVGKIASIFNMQVIILLFLIALAWYLSGLMADSYALKKRIRELEKINETLLSYIPESDYEIN